MKETDNNNHLEKPGLSKARIALTALCAVCFLIGAILAWRSWRQFDVGSLPSDFPWRDVMWMILSVIVGCGCYILAVMNQAVKGRRYLIIGVYALILVLVALIYYFLVDFINNWIQY